MMLYSKLGSIPKPETDGTDGWIEVPEPPVAGDGEEVVWWFPPGWVVRPICPNEPGMAYNWSQSSEQWVATPVEPTPDPGVVIVPDPTPDTLNGSTGTDTISMGSASPA
jgi:hypothetical protein